MNCNKGILFRTVVLLLVLLPFCLISVYARPQADDYDFSLKTHTALGEGGGFPAAVQSAWETDVFLWHTMNGLYTSAFFQAMQPGIWGQQWYGVTFWIAAVVIFLCLWGVFGIIKKRLLGEDARFRPAFYALLGAFLLMTGFPSPQQGLYWYNGMMNYTPWAMLTLLNVALQAEINRPARKGSMVWLLVASMVLSFLISGVNYIVIAANLMLLALCNVYFIFRKKRYWSLLPLCAALAGFTLCFLAPGVAARRALFAPTSLPKAAVHALIYTFDSVKNWTNLSFFAILALFAPAAYAVAKRLPEEAGRKFPWRTMLLGFVLLTGLFFVPFYTMGGAGGGRLINVIWLMFLLFGLYHEVMILRWLLTKNLLPMERIRAFWGRTRVQTVVFCCCIACLFVASPAQFNEKAGAFKALQEFADGTAKGYAAEMDARVARYTDGSLAEVAVEPLENRPYMLYLSDVTMDADVWPNTSISEYFGKPIYLARPYPAEGEE